MILEEEDGIDFGLMKFVVLLGGEELLVFGLWVFRVLMFDVSSVLGFVIKVDEEFWKVI